MEIGISMCTRDKNAFAEAIYLEGKVLVKAGGKISAQFKGVESVKKIRADKSIIDNEGNIIGDCVFNSPSTAAQFVNGNISNGMRVWKVNGEPLGTYLEKNGLK